MLVFCLGIPLGHDSQAAPKKIQLRTGPIETADKAAIRSQKPPGSPLGEAESGLFLIQFEEALQPAWRTDLEGMGIQLVRYVPEDAFVARVKQVRLDRIEALPFVRWVGPYGPQHKIEPGLKSRLGGPGGDRDVDVGILLARGADPAEARRVRQAFPQVTQEAPTRFGTIVRGRLPAGRVEALARSPEVLWVEPVGALRLYDEVASKIVAGDGGANRTLMMELGWDGSGVTVAVADSGLHNGDAESMHPDLYGRVTGFFHYGALEDASDGHGHGTHVAGIVAGNGAVGETDEEGALYGLGVAPGAHIVAQRLFDELGGYEPPPTFETMTRHAYRAGAEIGSNSWGDDSNGRYDLFAAEFDALVRDADGEMAGDQQYILEFSAGNAGPGYQTIGTPAVAKNVIATGASQNDRLDFFIYAEGQDAMADFSSRGPAEDGRIKPDLVAPGTWIASLQSASATDENAWMTISSDYQYQGGTSQAGPHVSGAAAIFVQYYRLAHEGATPSPALVKAALLNSAVDMDDEFGTGPIPNDEEGWGRLDLPRLIGGDRSYEFVDQTERLTTGQFYEHRVLLADADEPLKITLAYTDVPGFPGAIPALVNDLDLEVIGPDGRVYRGNQFEQGESVPGAPSTDQLNNVEGVHLNIPLPGEYVVRILARKVVEDACRDTPALVDQDFALVVSGTIPLPGIGVVFFDRRAYRAPDRIKVNLVDRDLAGQSSFTVNVRSSSDSVGEALQLWAANSFGLFTGAVVTATGPALAGDGQLQVAHEDLIEATYEDPQTAFIWTARARADLVPPLVSGVGSTNDLGRTTLFWQTDEPADSFVQFGTSPGSLTREISQSALTESHEVIVRQLIPGTTYYYQVSSADEAGNVTVDNHGGSLYQFVAPTPPSVLVVDDYVDELFPVPPLSGYTDALDQLGVSYAVWDVAQEGDLYPTLIDLEPFRAVLWRAPEFDFFANPFPPPVQQTLTAYLAGGGSLMVASMEVLSRLDNDISGPAFRRNVLHVESFEPDPFEGVPEVLGVTGDSIGDGLDLVLDYAPYDDEFKNEYMGVPSDLSDLFSPGAEADPILVDALSGEAVGLKYPRVGEDSPGRVVFLSFPLDAVPWNDPAPHNRVGLMRNILNFLAPPAGAATVVLNKTEYTVPSQVTVEVTDLELTGQGTATLQVVTSSDGVGRTVPLQETVRPGLFRGLVTLVATNSPHANELRAAHGDTIRADYLDESAGMTISAEAVVETIAPVLTGVVAEPDYVSAVIRWQTSEPSDALVQFGESAFLNRTAYRSSLRTDHELELTGLWADKTYYFQVVSRDLAGNVTVHDNAGQFHQFKTLQPLIAPWSDDLEQGVAGWAVYDVDGFEPGWEWGVPENEYGISAYSPVHAWATMVQGQVKGFVASALVSPPVLLTGGTQATLRFRQFYDFPDYPEDAWEAGEVFLYTDTAPDPISLGGLGEYSEGWEEVTVDLSPYLGSLVNISWEYLLLSVVDMPRPGWLIDDVSIAISGGAVERLLVLTNNLGQAAWLLTGPVSQSGGGVLTILTNAPAGDYTVQYLEVPYYQTPTPQSASLTPTGNLVFHGQYTFLDQNNNAISDAWEFEMFQEISPTRTDQTDTDADGASDHDEFIAGTDATDAGSVLAVATPSVLPGGAVQLQWPSGPGRIYRLEGSADAVNWQPVSEWIAAEQPVMTHVLTPEAAGGAFLFRLEVRP